MSSAVEIVLAKAPPELAARARLAAEISLSYGGQLRSADESPMDWLMLRIDGQVAALVHVQHTDPVSFGRVLRVVPTTRWLEGRHVKM